MANLRPDLHDLCMIFVKNRRGFLWRYDFLVILHFKELSFNPPPGKQSKVTGIFCQWGRRRNIGAF